MKSYLVLILGMLTWLSCTRTDRQTAQKPVVTVSIEPLRYFTQAIAGDRFQIACMVPQGSSPETYDPTPQQLVNLNRSRAFLQIGYIGYEQVWMDKLRMNAPHVRFFNISDGVSLIYDGHTCSHPHGHTAGVEPHTWSSTGNALILADNIYRALAAIDSAHTAYFRANLDSLKQRINRTDSIIRGCLKGKKPTFLIYHPALSYFARDYGLQQLSIEEGGKEPSPDLLRNLIRRCRRDSVKVIFIQREFDKRNAQAIARELDIPLVEINPLSYDWEKEMIRIAHILAKE